MNGKIVTIVGGSGFLGRYAVRQLAREGYRIRVVTRNPDTALHLKTAGDVGQIALIKGDLAQPDSIAGALKNAWAVINLVGILYESGRQNFDALQARGAERLAKMAMSEDVSRFIHISALGVDKSGGRSIYARTKRIGEDAALASFPRATILRPGVMFGPEDNFFNQFARIAAVSRSLPLIGGGKTRLQPVYVADVARAISACLTREDAAGKIFELGGPQMFTLKDIYRYILKTTGLHAALVPLPFPVASLVGTFAGLLPNPPLTRDQVTLLRFDSIVSPGSRGFAELGIAPVPVDAIVPGYLARFGKKAMAA